jgi:hypothetical protein
MLDAMQIVKVQTDHMRRLIFQLVLMTLNTNVNGATSALLPTFKLTMAPRDITIVKLSANTSPVKYT